MGFVSYGGVSSGTCAVQMLKEVTLALRMVSAVEAVNIPFASDLVGEAGRFDSRGVTIRAAVAMLDELMKLSTTMGAIRKSPVVPPGSPGGTDA